MVFRLLRQWLGKRRRGFYPECLWTVEFDDELITVKDDRGILSNAPRDSLRAVVIETNDSGPWGADLWWILDGPEGMLVAFPQGASGEPEAATMLQALPGFDWVKLGQAIRSTRNATFVVWKSQR